MWAIMLSVSSRHSSQQAEIVAPDLRRSSVEPGHAILGRLNLKGRLIGHVVVPRDRDIFAFGKDDGGKSPDQLADDVAARQTPILAGAADQGRRALAAS